MNLGLVCVETSLVAPPLEDLPVFATLVDEYARIEDPSPAIAPLTSATASVLDLEGKKDRLRDDMHFLRHL